MHQRFGNFHELHDRDAYQGDRLWQRDNRPRARHLFACLVLSGGLTACANAPEPPRCDVAPALSAEECAAVHGLALPAALPTARGNRWADDLATSVLGFHLFYDSRLSANLDIRCATCHDPGRQFNDQRATSSGLGPVPRNAPTLLNAAWNQWQFWDGRADSLWSQPLFPLENPAEMGLTRLAVAHLIADAYASDYRAIFGPLPDLSNARRFPPQGKPGDVDYDAMSASDRQAVDTIFANVGKALEAYLRRLAAGPAPWDAYLQGDTGAISPAAQRGITVFVRAGCIQCHHGSNFTDDSFHNLGVPDTPAPDLGRAGGLPILLVNPFNSQGLYYDGRTGRVDIQAAAVLAPAYVGAFKTPSLRNLAVSAPYGHAGQFPDLAGIVDFHLQGGGRQHFDTTGRIDPLLQPVPLTAGEHDDLMAFLQTLRGAYRGEYNSPPYWWDWPDR